MSNWKDNEMLLTALWLCLMVVVVLAAIVTIPMAAGFGDRAYHWAAQDRECKP